MRRSWLLLAVAISMMVSGIAQADGPIRRFWDDLCRSTARNNAWPDPFIPADRAAVQNHLQVVIDQGWMINNTLSDYHFDETGLITEAGELRVRTIMQEYIACRRVVFVLKSNDPVIDGARSESTYAVATKFALPGDIPRVGETNVRPDGWPASFVVAVDRAYEESMPQPRLPQRSSSSAAGAGT